MANLLHLDSSLRHQDSVSRQVSGTFATEWRRRIPAARTYVCRDLPIDPPPHPDPA